MTTSDDSREFISLTDFNMRSYTLFKAFVCTDNITQKTQLLLKIFLKPWDLNLLKNVPGMRSNTLLKRFIAHVRQLSLLCY